MSANLNIKALVGGGALIAAGAISWCLRGDSADLSPTRLAWSKSPRAHRFTSAEAIGRCPVSGAGELLYKENMVKARSRLFIK